MADKTYLTYQKFKTKEEAIELAELLASNQILYQIENTSASFDSTFSNSEANNEFRIKLQQQDFEIADELLLSITANQLDDVEKDHYLYEFSDEELIDVLAKSDEWSAFDYLLAQKILTERGLEINQNKLESLKKQRIEDLAKPADSQKDWIIAGYLFSVLGGFIGLFIGWHLLSHKKTLPNGETVYGYSDQDRKQGNKIVITALVFLVIWLLVLLLSTI